MVTLGCRHGRTHDRLAEIPYNPFLHMVTLGCRHGRTHDRQAENNVEGPRIKYKNWVCPKFVLKRDSPVHQFDKYNVVLLPYVH
jgi:hypothetical protein